MNWTEITVSPARVCVVMRGLPASGKSTKATVWAKQLNAVVASADNYFVTPDGRYEWDATKLPEAHAWCRAHFDEALRAGRSVVVDNTNVLRKHFAYYVEAALRAGYTVKVDSLFDGGCTDEQLVARNVHGVKLHSIQRMRKQWEA